MPQGWPQGEPRFAALLATGAVQVLDLSVADHAAVDLSVRLAKAEPGLQHRAGLVNAVLRRLVRERAEIEAAPLDALDVNTPPWLAARWRSRYGEATARRIAEAHAAGAAVLHLGQGDLPVPAARALVGDDVLIGRSTHSEAEAAAAAVQEGVDYFCTGPCWPTPTKPGRPAPGLDLVRYAAGLDTDRPWFAIGGIDLGNLDEVLDAGARRVVVVRALTEADDPGAAAAAFAQRLRER